MALDFARPRSHGSNDGRARTPVANPTKFVEAVASEIVTPRRRASVSGVPLGRLMPPEQRRMTPEITPRQRRASVGGMPVSVSGVPMHSSSMLPGESAKPSDLRFDVLRLREWFNKMDQDRCGHVSKKQFMHFIASQPQLLRVLVNGHESQLSGEEAVCWRRLSKMWRELCDESSNQDQMEWSSFVEFFRRQGMLLEYKTKDNPKDRLAHMLADMHAKPLEQQWRTVDEFARLRKTHLQGRQQSELGQTLEEFVRSRRTQIQVQPETQPGIPKAVGLTIMRPPSSRSSTKAPSSN